MKFILFVFFLFPSLVSANTELIKGKWIGTNANFRLILKFSDKNILELNSYPKSETSTYPKLFEFSIQGDNIMLLDEDEVIDSFKIIKLNKNELIVNIFENEMAFFKINDEITSTEIELFLVNNSYLIQYNDQISTDTIINQTDFQVAFVKNFNCISFELDFFKLKRVNSTPLIDLNLFDEKIEVFIESFKENSIKGKYFSNSRFEDIEIIKINSVNWEFDTLEIIQNKLLGKWVWLGSDEIKFNELRDKKHNTLFINYRKINFLDDFNYTAGRNNQDEVGKWRIKKLNATWFIQFKEGNSNSWGGIRILKEITDQYMIIEDFPMCSNFGLGHRNRNRDNKELYLIKN